jgi:hypothetical protein
MSELKNTSLPRIRKVFVRRRRREDAEIARESGMAILEV